MACLYMPLIVLTAIQFTRLIFAVNPRIICSGRTCRSRSATGGRLPGQPDCRPDIASGRLCAGGLFASFCWCAVSCPFAFSLKRARRGRMPAGGRSFQDQVAVQPRFDPGGADPAGPSGHTGDFWLRHSARRLDLRGADRAPARKRQRAARRKDDLTQCPAGNLAVLEGGHPVAERERKSRPEQIIRGRLTAKISPLNAVKTMSACKDRPLERGTADRPACPGGAQRDPHSIFEKGRQDQHQTSDLAIPAMRVVQTT
jgi:hypothetical protein